jgi:hypothetical protein
VEDSARTRLETAFWQQHPHLLHIATFVREHRQTACTAHIKELVAHGVRNLWESCASQRDSLLASICVVPRDQEESGHYLISTYSAATAKELTAQHTKTCAEGRVFISDFLTQRLSAHTLPELCGLYPAESAAGEAVTQVAVSLMLRQARSNQGPLEEFLAAYVVLPSFLPSFLVFFVALPSSLIA